MDHVSSSTKRGRGRKLEIRFQVLLNYVGIAVKCKNEQKIMSTSQRKCRSDVFASEIRCDSNYTKRSRERKSHFTLVSVNKATKSIKKGFYKKTKTVAMGGLISCL